MRLPGGLRAALVTASSGALAAAALALTGCPGRGGGADEPRAEAVPPELEWPDAAVLPEADAAVPPAIDAGP